MARRTQTGRKGRASGKPSDESAGQPVGQESDASEDMSGATLFDRVGDDGYLVVHYMQPDLKQWRMEGRLEPSEATEEGIQAIWGGGKYMIREKVRGARGQYEWGRQRTIFIAGPHKEGVVPPPVREKGAGAKNEPTLISQQLSGGNMENVIAGGVLGLLKTQQDFTALIMQKMAAPPPPSSDSLKDVVLPLITALMPVLEKLVARKETEKPSDVMALVREVASLVKEKTSSTEDFGKMVAMMNDVLELKDRAAGEGTGDPLLDIIGDNLPKIITMVQDAQRQQGRPVQPAHVIEEQVRARVAETKAPALPPPLNTALEGANVISPLEGFLRIRGKLLLGNARDNVPPDVVADYEWAVMPAPFKGAVREFMGREDALALLVQALPGAAQYQQWFTEFHAALHMAIFPEQYEEEDIQPEIVGDVGAEGGSAE